MGRGAPAAPLLISLAKLCGCPLEPGLFVCRVVSQEIFSTFCVAFHVKEAPLVRQIRRFVHESIKSLKMHDHEYKNKPEKPLKTPVVMRHGRGPRREKSSEFLFLREPVESLLPLRIQERK